MTHDPCTGSTPAASRPARRRMNMNQFYGNVGTSSRASVTRQKGKNSPISCNSRRALQVLIALVTVVLFILPVTAISIDPLGDWAAGDRVTVSGSTVYPVGSTVWVEVKASDFQPTSKYASIEQLSGESKASGTVLVTKGPGAEGKNVWSINFSTSGWVPGEYTVRAADSAGGSGTMLWASSLFNLTSGPVPARAGTISPPGAQPSDSGNGIQDANLSGSSPGAGGTGPIAIPGINGDPGLTLPLLVGFCLALSAGGGYYYIKMRPPQAPPPPVPPVAEEEPASPAGKQSTGVPPLIFLSAKSEDYAAANQVYSHLTGHGHSVFFSDQTLPHMGNSDYRREIDRALEHAKHLVVVTSRKEYVESKWVEAEWGSFINEKRSGRKDGNIIVLLAGPMKIGDLPISLRSFETRSLDNQKTLDQILVYLS